jgi:hypothetical protein
MILPIYFVLLKQRKILAIVALGQTIGAGTHNAEENCYRFRTIAEGRKKYVGIPEE